MNEHLKNFLIKIIWITLIFSAAIFFVYKPNSANSIFTCIAKSITPILIITVVYETWLWRFNPFEKIPKIMGKYSGTIEYNYNGKNEKKKVQIEIKQSLLTVNVKITTDEITSSSTTSNIVFENGEYVLYYTYITNPKSKYSETNPIQRGTCRLNSENENLVGTYWTSRRTIGDIKFKRIQTPKNTT